MAAEPAAGPASISGPAESTRTDSKRSRAIVLSVGAVALLLVAGSLLTSRTFGGRDTEALAPAEIAVKEGDPDAVAAKGMRLGRVTTPPKSTHVLLALPAGTPEYSFAVVFEPYGIGPKGEIVMRVGTATAEGGNEQAATLAKRFTNQNFLVRPGVELDARALRGGEYAGTIRTVAEKEGYALVLAEAAPR